MRVIAVVQARLASTRLSGKVLAEIAGRPMLAHVIERVAAIPGVDAVMLTTPREDFPQLYPMAARQLHARPFTGSAHRIGWVPHEPPDVLSGIARAAENLDADVLLRITADCPLLDPALAGLVLAHVLVYGVPYAHNLNPPTEWAEGLDVQAFTREALEREIKALEGRPASEREHPCRWMGEHERTAVIPGVDGLKDQHWMVDTPEDLERVRRIYALLTPGNFSWRHTLNAAREARIV